MKHSAEQIGVSRETQERLQVYAALLRRWNQKINLIGKADEELIEERHIADSLQLAPLFPAATQHAIDLGSGGGLPGLILAIATGVHFDLVEADKRKAAFLREAARATNAPASVYKERAETVKIAPAELITARGFAPLLRLLDIAYPLLAPGGYLLLPKGANVEQELTASLTKWKMRVEKFSSQTRPGATILRVSEVARA